MRSLSNETVDLLQRYEAQLCALEISIQYNRTRLSVTCHDSELSYIDQHFQKMLDNITSQKIWCHTLTIQ